MISKTKVQANFSKRAADYDRHAATQRLFAAKLVGMLAEFPPPRPPERVLEIGCGTGFVTAGVVRLYPGAQFVVTDLSETMLGLCRGKLAVQAPDADIVFARMDGEAPDRGGFDLVVTGFAMQWFSELPAVLRRYHDALRPGGRLAFSSLTEGTFGQLRRSFAELGVTFPAPPPPSVQEHELALAVFASRDIRFERHLEPFASAMDFLRSVNNIGAGNPTAAPLPPGLLRKVIAHHQRTQADGGGGVNAEFDVLYGVCSRG